MDTSDPEIRFDESGVCSHCAEYAATIKRRILPPAEAKSKLDWLLDKIRREGSGREYNCMIGISGGVDSCYLAYLAKSWGLKPLAFHFDSGWNSELAVDNIHRLLEKLEIPLCTFVCDWAEMKELQKAYLRSGTVNCDIPQDHGIISSLYSVAAKHRIRNVLVGTNVVTESILPNRWRGHRCTDLTSINAIFRKFGAGRLKRYPRLGLFKRYFLYRYIHPVEQHGVLNLIQYNKAEAKEILMREFGWRDYGGKHFESVYTRFHQGFYLPQKFGYDKRRCHLSTLILSGQISRDNALEEMKQAPYPPELMKQEKQFVLKKLDLSHPEFDALMKMPERSYLDFRNEEWIQSLINCVGLKIRKFRPERQI